MIHQIATDLYSRQAILENKVTNFRDTLPDSTSELSLEIIKDPYIFDFISTKKTMKEIDFENALVKNITDFLLELGSSFAFVGQQYHLVVDGDDYYIDLLFYNIKLHSYVVIELKTTKFKPDYIGQLNFYVNAIDEQIKKDEDNSTIGILLCKEKKTNPKYYQLLPNHIEGITTEHIYRISPVFQFRYFFLFFHSRLLCLLSFCIDGSQRFFTTEVTSMRFLNGINLITEQNLHIQHSVIVVTTRTPVHKGGCRIVIQHACT